LIAVDTNILVYAHCEDSPFQARAFRCPQVHDARVAAPCRQHGVRELWSADRDFGRFAGLAVTNPLVAGGPS
jgi:predicted nucleic acid-binding protein